MRLKGRTAIVLGASAEGGVGWHIAERLAREGAHVAVAARSPAPLARLAQRIDGLAFPCDAANAEQVAALVRQTKQAFGSLDLAVNAAALAMPGFIADLGMDDVQRALDVNYLAHVNFVRESAAAMETGGAIILFSSSVARQPMIPHFSYACAKAATDCLVRFAAIEYGPRGIRVNSILPGPIKSNMADFLWQTPGVEQAFAREIPLGRIGVPDDYADAVLWLADATFVTGLNIPISGGNHLSRLPRPDELPLGSATYEPVKHPSQKL